MEQHHHAHGTATDQVDWVAAVRQVLEGMPRNHALLLPVRDGTGEVTDFQIAAASPGTADSSGRPREQLIGARLRRDYGGAVQGAVWEEFRDAYADGATRTVGPFSYPAGAMPHPASFTARVRRVGAGLLNSWIRDDDPGHLDERIAQTERLANLGWSEQDPVTGTTVWSDQLYRIYERDPAAGPMSAQESEAVTVPEDRPIRREAAERLSAGRPADVTYRIGVGGRTKHIRAIAETVRDVHGRPLRVYGIVQDVTARIASRTRIARIERQLFEHQQTLAAESRLVAELQQIILPIPVTPVDLPGLRVAVRYLPAERASRVGGDWFHAATALDGSTVLAVGDLAGHGIRAAAAMAQVRYAFATLAATTTSDPATLLGHLNRLMFASDEPASIASAVVARYEPARGALVWAQAGHPAPLLAHAGATVELERPPGPLLGAIPESDYGTASLTIRDGEVLLFFTDGLIERRGRSLVEGLQPVITTLNRVTAAGGRHPLADLIGQLRRANPDDDTCILAARRLSAGDLAAVGSGDHAAGETPPGPQLPA